MKTLMIFFLSILTYDQIISQPTWNYQNSGTTNNLNSISIRYSKTDQMLFIAGDDGTVLKSSNMGLIWESVNSSTVSDLNSIDISYGDTGFAAGSNGTVIKTTDGGNSWSGMTGNTSNSIKDIKYMYGNIRAVAVGDNGTFMKLENNVWSVIQIDTTDLNSVSYDVFNTDRIIAVGNYGTILRSTNSGANWIRVNGNTFNDLNKVSNYNLIIGNSGTAIQISGNTIINLITGTTNNFYGIYSFNNSYTVCGANGLVFRNWQPINTNSNQKLNSVIQTNIDNCFVTGDNGLIMFTNTLNITPYAKLLNSNNISAWFINNGLYNHNPAGSSGFEWPKGEGRFARYTSGSVIGAIVNGDTLVTVCNYGSEYLPGFTDNTGNPQGNGNPYYRLYKMIFNQNDSDRINWPNVLLGNSDQGAPVYFDSALMQWKPVDYGNQTMFYSFTDSYHEAHNVYSGMTSPLKADIKQINWSFNQPEELKNIIYQEFRIINRSNNIWSNAYINLFSDDDIGVATDDKSGVDTNYSLTYSYNGTNEDGIYGFAPPAAGFVVVRSPLRYTGNIIDTVYYCEGKRRKIKTGFKEIGLNSTVIFRDDGLQPSNYSENYNAIRGLQNNGSLYINPTSILPTNFVYSGDPVLGTGWLYPGESDARFYQGFGPLNMNPGDTQIIVIAQVVARGSSNINSITKLRETAQTAKNYYNDCFSNVVIGISDNTSTMPEGFELYQNYPNPFNPVTHLEFGISDLGFVTLKVYDMLGKEVKTLVNENLKAGRYKFEFDGNNLPSGIYFYKIESGNFISTKKMMLIK